MPCVTTPAPGSLRYRPSPWRSTATKAEYFYDYAAQDPINGYDLNGTMINAMNDIDGRKSISVTTTGGVRGGGRLKVTITAYAPGADIYVTDYQYKLTTNSGQSRTWRQDVAQTPLPPNGVGKNFVQKCVTALVNPVELVASLTRGRIVKFVELSSEAAAKRLNYLAIVADLAVCAVEGSR
jgi:hypothetical protein